MKRIKTYMDISSKSFFSMFIEPSHHPQQTLSYSKLQRHSSLFELTQHEIYAYNKKMNAELSYNNVTCVYTPRVILRRLCYMCNIKSPLLLSHFYFYFLFFYETAERDLLYIRIFVDTNNLVLYVQAYT